MMDHDAFHRLLQEVVQIDTDVPEQQQQQQGTTVESGQQNYNVWDNILDPFAQASSNSSTVHGATDVGVSAVLTALGVNVVVFVMLIASYEIFSRLLPSVYRSRSLSRSSTASKSTEGERQPVNLPPTFMPFGWVPGVLRVSWSQLRKSGGLDAYMFLRYIRMCFQIVAVSGLWGSIILWPIYATGGNDADGWYHLSMANITQGSWRLWIPAIFLWLQTLYVVFIMKEEYKHFVDCRMEFLAKGDADVDPQQKYSLMVEEIPYELRSDKAMHDYFDALFPGRIYSACVVLNVPDLEALSNKRKRVLRRLEKSMAIKEATGRKPVHIAGRPRFRCCGVERLTMLPAGRKETDLHDEDGRLPQRGERVNSINYYTRYLAILNEKMTKLQDEKRTLALSGDDSVRASQWISHTLGLASDAAVSTLTRSRYAPSENDDGLILEFSSTGTHTTCSFIRQLGFDFLAGGFRSLHYQLDVAFDSVVGTTMSSTAFVTFTDLATVTYAVRAPLSNEAGVLDVQMAPEPRDILWENAYINQSWSRGREWTANVLLALGAILWSMPVATLQALANLDSLSTIPGLGGLSKLSGGEFAAFVNGYLPVIALLGITMLLPIAFQQIAIKYELRKTESDVQKSILARFFYYQLANIYVTVTAGSILDGLSAILDQPFSNAFKILGTSVPSVVGYFIMLLMTKVLAGLPLVLLRIGPLLRMLFLKMVCREKILTQRELDEMYKQDPLSYGREYPTQLLVIVICFTYSVISPVILPVGAIYFLGAFLVYKKQVLVVYSPTYESGGMNFPAACNRTLIGLVCGQITLIGYTVIRAGFYQPIFLLPLPIYTIVMMHSFKRLYEDPAKYLSLERAIDLDKEANNTSKFTEFSEQVYRQPVLTETDAKPQPYRRANGSFSEQGSDLSASEGATNSFRMDPNFEKVV